MIRSLRSTADLIELPFAFALRDRELLLPDKFRDAMRERGISVVEQELEALHRTRILVPFLRIARNAREIVATARRDPDAAWYLAYWKPSRPEDFREERAAGRVYDPAREKFSPWGTYRGRLTGDGDLNYHKSVFLYAPFQLVALPLVREVLPHLSWRRNESVGALNVEASRRKRWASEAQRLREIAFAASAIEPAYYSQVIGFLRLSGSLEEAESYYRWRQKLPLQRMLRWLGINAPWLVTAAEELLEKANRIDPLGEWWEVIAQGDFKIWPKLRREALSAMDFRVAAEVLLRYHDDLVDAGKAKAPPERPERWPRPLDYRLKPRRSIDALLMKFGLSPHPRLVLVLEGPTELLLVPRVMRFLGLRIGGDFIAIESAEGADRDLSPLLAYLAPKFEEPRDERFVLFARRPSRFLIVLDPEGKVSTVEQREKRRKDWVKRIMRTLPVELKKTAERSEIVREQMEQFVFVETWRSRQSESFEFAHFTDLELAEVIHALDARTPRPSVETLRKAIASVRAKHRSLDPILHDAGICKPAHAEALWSKLERKLIRARTRGRLDAIPVVRVIDRATRLANEWTGQNIAIALERRLHERTERR